MLYREAGSCSRKRVREALTVGPLPLTLHPLAFTLYPLQGVPLPRHVGAEGGSTFGPLTAFGKALRCIFASRVLGRRGSSGRPQGVPLRTPPKAQPRIGTATNGHPPIRSSGRAEGVPLHGVQGCLDPSTLVPSGTSTSEPLTADGKSIDWLRSLSAQLASASGWRDRPTFGGGSLGSVARLRAFGSNRVAGKKRNATKS